MESLKLKKQLDERNIVDTMIAVNDIRKINNQQMMDVFSVTPNHLTPIVERANEFLQKVAHIAKMHKLQDACEDIDYIKKHPKDVDIVNKYFEKDRLQTDKFWDEIVAAGCLYRTIGKFCISTEKFLWETQGVPWNNRNEILRNIIDGLEDELKEREEDELDVNRYAYRFFKKLLDKNPNIFPNGVTVYDIQRYIKMYIYDDEKNM